jgi:mannitol 2-dehydrogenase
LIGSLIDLAWGEEDSEPIIERVASEETKIITLTITEGGYTVHFDQPHSVFWYVAEGLKRRMEKNLPITILSCDNMQHNGDAAKHSFLSYFEVKYPELVEWVEGHVTFPNSMVDRITPATKSGKITDVNCEDFIQWVVEDRFIAGRPAWERVGVTFTQDVTPYETMKLSLLNASHTLLSYPSYMEGFLKVDEVLADPRYRTLIKTFMDRDVTPYVPAPEQVDLEAYKQQLLERFSNAAISDQVSRICGDGVAKFAVYVVPILQKILRDEKDFTIEAFLIASYAKYMRFGKTEAGIPIEIFEPHITEKDHLILTKGNAVEFLQLSCFAPLKLASHNRFLDAYLRFYSVSVSEGLKKLQL